MFALDEPAVVGHASLPLPLPGISQDKIEDAKEEHLEIRRDCFRQARDNVIRRVERSAAG
jgi:hypothetical protein